MITFVNGSCDDGNTINGDGCSAACLVEDYYRCSGGSSTSPSVCVYTGISLTASLKKIRKTEDFNQGIFQFNIYPPLLSLA
jgi:cysteine-rich repeat protein